jgi:hypothetical protein
MIGHLFQISWSKKASQNKCHLNKGFFEEVSFNELNKYSRYKVFKIQTSLSWFMWRFRRFMWLEKNE